MLYWPTLILYFENPFLHRNSCYFVFLVGRLSGSAKQGEHLACGYDWCGFARLYIFGNRFVCRSCATNYLLFYFTVWLVDLEKSRRRGAGQTLFPYSNFIVRFAVADLVAQHRSVWIFAFAYSKFSSSLPRHRHGCRRHTHHLDDGQKIHRSLDMLDCD